MKDTGIRFDPGTKDLFRFTAYSDALGDVLTHSGEHTGSVVVSAGKAVPASPVALLCGAGSRSDLSFLQNSEAFAPCALDAVILVSTH